MLVKKVMMIKENSSFRDPAGFIYYDDGKVYRQINKQGMDDYSLLMASGLYDKLLSKSYLIEHKEIENNPEKALISPKTIEFISYPYEWSFQQLKDAALLTLEIQKIAIDSGVCLKDASAYNIQFSSGKPVFIDTLSFEKYDETKPWVAYKQFCQHFLAPLALMAKKDINLNALLVTSIDGIDLSLADKVLKPNPILNPLLYMHISAHARVQSKKSQEHKKITKINFSKQSMLGLVESLIMAVNGLKVKQLDTEWGNYYNITNYSNDAFKDKHELVAGFVKRIGAKSVFDAGGNNGEFSRSLANDVDFIICADIDPIAVNLNYAINKEGEIKNIYPLLLNLTNPSPAIGWNNDERKTLKDRVKVDCVMALALIHHLAISNNVPLSKIAEFFAGFGNNLIIEFVPKADSQVKKLLLNREDIFVDYDVEGFEKEFSKHFNIIESQKVKGTVRTLYLMEKK